MKKSHGSIHKTTTDIYSENQLFRFLSCSHDSHYENLPMQYTETFSAAKVENFHQEYCDIFLIFAQNRDCGYTLEPPQHRYTPAYPSFTI